MMIIQPLWRYATFCIMLSVLTHANAQSISIQGQNYWLSELEAKRSNPPLWEEFNNQPKAFLYSFGSAETEATSALRRIEDWNSLEVNPPANGFARPLANPQTISLGTNRINESSTEDHAVSGGIGHVIETSEGDTIWAASIKVEGSYRLRVQIESENLPATVKFWVSGTNRESIGPFGSELLGVDGTIWTPSVEGPVITLHALVPRDSKGVDFAVPAILEIFRLNQLGKPITDHTESLDLSCLEDTQCISTSTFSAINEAERAIGFMEYIRDGSSYTCSGGLVNDTVSDTKIPYFLTANHCVGTQLVADTLEVFWDYKTNSCNGTVPSLMSLPRTNGATVVATGADQDFSLLRLNSLPSGRWLLGWHPGSSEISTGRTLHRISHPKGQPQNYSQGAVDGDSMTCTDWPRSNYIYQSQTMGSVERGSSGSPTLNNSGQIVGQHRGRCGSEDYDLTCILSNFSVDGSFSSYFTDVQQYLSPSDEPPASSLINDEGLNGLFWDPNKSGHGFDVVRHENGLVIYYYGHTFSGERLWLISDNYQGDIEYDVSLQIDMFEVFEGSFGNPKMPTTGWGSVNLTFFDCDTGRARLSGNDGTLEFDFVRLVGLPGMSCN